MPTLTVTELRNGVIFEDGDQLLKVINYEHKTIGRGSGNIKVKVKNLKTGSIIEKSFTSGGRVEAASLEKKKTTFLYQDGDSYNFMDPETFDQFLLDKSVLGEQARYLKANLEVQLQINDGEAIGLELPNNLVYEITETGPGEKGNTVSNVYKDAVLDNGLAVKVPMFTHVGDKIKVDTRTGQYVERVR
jgi:elongation factor P